MDNKDELIQMPTLSFPAYKKAQRPRWLLILGAMVTILGIAAMILALMNS